MSNTVPIKAAFKTGWHAAGRHLFFYLGVFIIQIVINYVPNIAIRLLPQTDLGGDLALVAVFVLATVLQIIVSMGLIKIAITMADQQDPTFSQLFSEYPKFWRYVGVSLLVGIITFIGFLLLIIPGIYLALRYLFATYFVIDKNSGVFQAMAESSRITKGVKWQLFGFGILVFLVNLLGILAFGVGIIVTTLITIVAYAYVYRQLSTRSNEAAPAKPAIPLTQPVKA